MKFLYHAVGIEMGQKEFLPNSVGIELGQKEFLPNSIPTREVLNFCQKLHFKVLQGTAALLTPTGFCSFWLNPLGQTEGPAGLGSLWENIFCNVLLLFISMILLNVIAEQILIFFSTDKTSVITFHCKYFKSYLEGATNII